MINMQEYEKSIMVQKIHKVADNFGNDWQEMLAIVEKMNEVWSDSASSEYIEKFHNVQTVVDSILSHLTQLESCWKNYSGK